MSDLTKFSDGASILQQVDVSEIFKNLALGIAEAQQKLDDNSIAQAIKLAETQINGVSLLELGFAPVFYAFQYADISASINLKMALKEALEFGFGLDLELSKTKGYSESSHTFLSEDNYTETTEEYKAARQMTFFAKEKKAVKINNKLVKQSESLQARSRVEKFKSDIKNDTAIGVDQVYEEIQSRKLTNNQSRGVDVWMDGGFLRIEEGIHFGKSGVGILKISDYANDKVIDIDGGGSTASFELDTNLAASLAAAQDETGVLNAPIAEKLYGLSKDGDLYVYNLSTNTWDPISSTIYFPYNSDEIIYGESLKKEGSDLLDLDHDYPTTAADNENHDQHKLIHKILRLICSNDPDASITITGMTDPKGGNNPKNKSLAKRRAEKVRDHIFGTGSLVNVGIEAITNEAGNPDLLKRYAKIKLDSDYMVFIGGNVNENAAPVKDGPSANKFIYADDSTTSPNPAFNTLNVNYGDLLLNFTQTTFSALVNEVKQAFTQQIHSYEATSEQRHYFLDDNAIVKFSMYTNQSEEIQVEYVDENTSSGTEQKSSFMAGKTKNEKSMLNDTTNSKNQDSSFALGASVDFRMSRQFEMSMEGNAAMSARLVAVPAPQGFVVFLQNVYVSQTTD